MKLNAFFEYRKFGFTRVAHYRFASDLNYHIHVIPSNHIRAPKPMNGLNDKYLAGQLGSVVSF